MEQVVITGANSMLGIALLEKCVNEKVKVIAITRNVTNGLEDFVGNTLVHIEKLELEEYENFNTDLIVKTFGKSDVLFDFAWSSVKNDGRYDVFAQCDNIKYSLDAVVLAVKLGCKRYVGAGSQAEYGVNHDICLNSSTLPIPRIAYGAAKLSASHMTRVLCDQLGIEHIWTRTLSAYGIHDRPNTLIMQGIETLLRGDVLRVTKAEQLWDYIYSSDAANAFYLLAVSGKNGKTYCIGNGESRPLKSYIEELRQLINPSAKIEYGAIPYSSDGIVNLQVDISELSEDTGFTPKVSFSQGILNILNSIK